MAALRPQTRSALVLAMVLLGTLLPAGVARAAVPTLEVTKELAATGDSTVNLTATISSSQGTTTTINFEILPGPDSPAGPADQDGDSPNSPDAHCDIPSGQTTCSVGLISNQISRNYVRAWIAGQTADTSEGRLSNASALGGDCQGDEAGLPLFPTACQTGTVEPGAVPEPDATDVVQAEWLHFSVGRLDCSDSHPEDGTDVQYKRAPGDPTEQYNCLLTTTEGVPISGAHIDAKFLSGPDKTSNATTPDKNDLCQTGDDGRCKQPFNITVSQTGADIICFWAEPSPDMQGPAGSQTDHSNTYGSASTTDGKDCGPDVNLKADSPLRDDVTDIVYLDYDTPRAEGLDVTPDTILVSGASRFSLQGTVYDQFGQPFRGDTTLQAKLFPGSALAPDGNDDVGSLDPNLVCHTGGAESCSIPTVAQSELGTNLACVWISAPTIKTPARMFGSADQESSYCQSHQEAWQASPDLESHVDPSADDGRPSPPSDGLDVVRFSVRSNPKIAAVSPTDRRQDTSGDVLGIDGVNFLPSALITISGTGVTLGPTAVVSSQRVEASLAVAADAPPGPRDVTVTNRSDGGTVTCNGCFRVIGQGYWMVASDGGIFSFGDAKFAGSAGNQVLNKPIVAMAPTPSGLGYWLVASDGGIFNYGDAPFVGSAGALSLSKPIVSMAPTPSGRGYWLVASDGGVFNYGDARFFGATSRLTLSKPIVSIVATPSGRGYWLVASDGGIFSFGDAKFFGSTGNIVLNKPIIAMAPTKTGKGYWLVATDGGIFAFGDATFSGSTGNVPLNKPIVGVTTTPSGRGYWLVASDGGVFSFGDAKFYGSTGNIRLNQPIVSIARR